MNTTSKVLMSGHTAEPIRKLLIETAEWITKNGGSYSVKIEHSSCEWWIIYEFNWPEHIPCPTT